MIITINIYKSLNLMFIELTTSAIISFFILNLKEPKVYNLVDSLPASSLEHKDCLDMVE
jgi:hypothetical protein